MGAWIELVGGSLLLLGLFTRPVAFIISGEMAVAYWMFHAPASFYPVLNGGDAAILYTFVFLLLVFTGPGAWSIDGITAKRQGRADPAARLHCNAARLSMICLSTLERARGEGGRSSPLTPSTRNWEDSMSTSRSKSTTAGAPAPSDRNSLTIGPDGPILLHDVHFLK